MSTCYQTIDRGANARLTVLRRFVDASRQEAISAWNWVTRFGGDADWDVYEQRVYRWREDLRRLNEYEAANGLPLTIDDIEE